jgi:hypothetical protein
MINYVDIKIYSDVRVEYNIQFQIKKIITHNYHASKI